MNSATGISHCFKVLKLESHEDTLNNLQLRRTAAQGDLLNTLPQQAKDDYLLHYMLDVESRGSLLSVEDFKKPFDYTLNVAVDSAGAFEPRKIDLVETFNYLIGLRVKHIDAQPERGFITVTGALPGGETCLVLWRDCEVLDYEGVAKLCDKLAINPPVPLAAVHRAVSGLVFQPPSGLARWPERRNDALPRRDGRGTVPRFRSGRPEQDRVLERHGQRQDLAAARQHSPVPARHP